MTEITMSQVTDLTDPQLRKIAVRIARAAELAIEKVAANRAQPKKYPLASDPQSIEQVLASRFRALRPATQQAAATRAMNRINAPAAVRAARFGDLAGVDLTKPVAVDAQAQALSFPAHLKLPSTHLNTLTSLHGQVPASPGMSPQQTTKHLELRIHKVKCLDETDGFLGSEAGGDEIRLGGISIDETGDTTKVSAFTVGNDFDDGEQKTYSPPKQFTSFDLTEGTAFPKSYFVTLVLAEADMGGLPDFLNQLVVWAKAQVTIALTNAIGGAIGVSGGPVNAAIGGIVGAAVSWIFDLLKSIWEDDLFLPATVSVSIPSLTATWAGKTDSPEGFLTYTGHGGKYLVTYDWRLFA